MCVCMCICGGNGIDSASSHDLFFCFPLSPLRKLTVTEIKDDPRERERGKAANAFTNA